MNRKIIARVKGGLGNQLFIFSTAFALHKKTGYKLLIDKRSGFWFDRYVREYRLDNFFTKFKVSSLFFSIYIKLVDKFGDLYVFALINQIISLRRITEANYDDWEKDNAMLLFDDNFQDEIFFKEFKLDLINFFKKPSYSIDLSIKLLTPIGKTPVCIHGRMLRAYSSTGEIVDSLDPKILPISYFNRAIEKISSLVENPYYFIFSDDPDNFSKMLNIDSSVFYTVNHSYFKIPEVDFLLMQECTHFVISNSTYSWWAAWLSENEFTTIIAPKSKYWDNVNCVPKRWITL
jgi:hypothetical protein